MPDQLKSGVTTACRYEPGVQRTYDVALTPPHVRFLESEAWIDLRGTQLFALPLRGSMLVIVFDDRTSYGLIRLRVRNAKAAIDSELAALRS